MLSKHSRVAVRRQRRRRLLVHGRPGSCRLMIALRIVLLCRHPRVTLLELGHYWSASCWIARPPSFAVPSRTPEPELSGSEPCGFRVRGTVSVASSA